MANHLAVYNRKIFRVDYIAMMLEGVKTVDIKLSTRRIPPWQRINFGDWLYLKESSGPVVGRCLIPNVTYYELEPGSTQLLEILLDIQDQVGLMDEKHAHKMFEEKMHMKYASVFTLAEPEVLEQPIHIEKSDRMTWVADYNLPMELRMAFGVTDELNQI